MQEISWKQVCAVFAIIATGVFWPVVDNFFLSDSLDWLWIGMNADFPQYFLSNYTGVQGPGSYRPLITLIFSGMTNEFGVAPHAYHVLSVVVHGVNSILVWVLAARFFSEKPVIPVLAGLVFLVFPIHAEVVLWIAGYPDLFATFGMLCASVMFVDWLHSTKTRYIVTAIGFWVVALLAKESAVIMPLIFTLLYVVHNKTQWRLRTILSWVLPVGVIGVLYMAVRWISLGGLGSYSVQATQISITGIVESAITAVIIPVVWSVQWQHQILAMIRNHIALSAIAVLLGIGCIALYLRVHRKTLATLALTYGLLFAPASILQFSSVSAEGERFIYTASIAVSIAIAYALLSILSCKRYQAVIGVVLMLFVTSQWMVRHDDYARASERVEHILEQSHNLPPMTHDNVTRILIGLPEFSYYAPVLRNGIMPAFYMMNVPNSDQYTRLPVFQIGQTCTSLEWEQVTNGLLSSSGRFSGPPTIDTAHIMTELWGYDYHTHIGEHLKLLLRDDESPIAALQDGMVEYWYWDCTTWKQLTVE